MHQHKAFSAPYDMIVVSKQVVEKCYSWSRMTKMKIANLGEIRFGNDTLNTLLLNSSGRSLISLFWKYGLSFSRHWVPQIYIDLDDSVSVYKNIKEIGWTGRTNRQTNEEEPPCTAIKRRTTLKAKIKIHKGDAIQRTFNDWKKRSFNTTCELVIHV